MEPVCSVLDHVYQISENIMSGQPDEEIVEELVQFLRVCIRCTKFEPSL